ncbi:MAG: PrsW family intramembrane metalloprotease [Chloroflexota bacterium]
MLPWLLILAVAPAVFWMWWFYRKDRFDPEPRGLIVKIFLLGMLPVLPAGIVEIVLFNVFPFVSGTGLVAIALANLFIVGPVEEVGKYLVVRRWALRHPAFNEPLDGIVYAAAAALGFAALENFFYLIDNGAWLILIRGPLSTLNHVLFAAIWGYAVGMASVQTDPGEASRLVRNGLIMGSLGHGVSNTLLLAQQSDSVLVWSPLMAILFAGFLYREVSKNIATSLASSPFQLTSAPSTLHGPNSTEPERRNQ